MIKHLYSLADASFLVVRVALVFESYWFKLTVVISSEPPHFTSRKLTDQSRLDNRMKCRAFHHRNLCHSWIKLQKSLRKSAGLSCRNHSVLLTMELQCLHYLRCDTVSSITISSIVQLRLLQCLMQRWSPPRDLIISLSWLWECILHILIDVALSPEVLHLLTASKKCKLQ